jgi:endonuclease-3
MTGKIRLQKVMGLLGPRYPDHRPRLHYKNPFELLIATVLAAQCSDAAVNLVTPALFSRFPDPAALAEAPPEELEGLIRQTGFFRVKSRNIKTLSGILRDEYGGAVPRTMEDLTRLPGVGRKTAGVVLSTFFGVPAIIVDTHFGRVSRRLGLTRSEDPGQIEKDIAALAPEEEWTGISHVLNRHGWSICHARKPECEACPVGSLCLEREGGSLKR